MKMPKLTLIKFNDYEVLPEPRTEQTSKSNNKTEEIDVLDSFTTIEFIRGNIENRKDWIIYSLPNLRHLILPDIRFPSTDRELVPILNKRIQRLDIYTNFQFKQLIKKSSVYFSNVQHINIYLAIRVEELRLYADAVKILKNFKNLKTIHVQSV